METSNPFSFKNLDWTKVGRGALFAIAGALLTYLTQLIPSLNIPAVYLPVVTAVLSIGANVLHKFVQE